jgi:hypothetical protein
MTRETKRERKPGERRRFLGLLGGLGAACVALPFLRVAEKPKELALKEADFYRPHDLAG